MSSPAQDIATIISNAGLGVIAASSGWAIFTGRVPTSPDTVITTYDTGGRDPNAKFLLEEQSIQVSVRGAKGGYALAFDRMQSIKDTLLGAPQQTVDGILYVGIWGIGDIIALGYDDNNRPLLVSNWRVAREPPDSSPSTHRQSL